MNEFTKHEPVTITDTTSPFYLWAGTVEKIGTGDAADYYTIKCSYLGHGFGTVLWLTFHADQLERGIPKEDAR